MSERPSNHTRQWSRKGIMRVLVPGLVIILLAVTSLVVRTRSATMIRPSSKGAGKYEPAKVVATAEAGLNRLVLTEKAAARIGIQTAPVREEQVVRKRTVGGKVVTAGAGRRSQPGVWVQVHLTESELPKVDLSQPVRIFPQAPAEKVNIITAKVVQVRADEDDLFYAVNSGESSLVPGQRVRVELSLLGHGTSGTPRLIVPYSAVLYDLRGETWVYTNPEPLTYVRHRIRVDYIENDVAILSEGPPAGSSTF